METCRFTAAICFFFFFLEKVLLCFRSWGGSDSCPWAQHIPALVLGVFGFWMCEYYGFSQVSSCESWELVSSGCNALTEKLQQEDEVMSKLWWRPAGSDPNREGLMHVEQLGASRWNPADPKAHQHSAEATRRPDAPQGRKPRLGGIDLTGRTWGDLVAGEAGNAGKWGHRPWAKTRPLLPMT